VGSVDVHVEIDGNGRTTSATAEAIIHQPPSVVWRIVEDVDQFPGRIPMISKVKLNGNRATVQLKFRLSLFSVGFEFVVDVKSEEGKWVELAYVSGEPKGIKLRFDLEPGDPEGKSTRLKTTGAFDVMSLGWLAKYFLKHHPEIQFGVIPGVAVGLLESIRAAAMQSSAAA
jgi:carbon monoxide dehydrogenase subunit G